MNQFLIEVANAILENEEIHRQAILLAELGIVNNIQSESNSDPTNEDLKIKLAMGIDKLDSLKIRFKCEMAELVQSAQKEIMN